jgi:plasmid stabilization system protein ParE
MNLEPVYRRIARLEYFEALQWYEAQRSGLGHEWVEKVDQAIASACETPERFAVVERDVRSIRVRKFPYRVYYRVRAQKLIVLAIYHAGRDPAVLFRRF